MQLTGPLFLFLFFPLTLLLVPLVPQRYHKATLSLLSILWCVLANFRQPLALLQLAAVVISVAVLAALPDGEYSKLRCAAGILIPLVGFVGARIAAEYGPASYPYPYGLTMVTLAAISLSVDRYRCDAPDRDSFLSVAGYLLFFPTLSMGPILRYKQYLYVMEHAQLSLERCSRGVRLYMLGFIKRLAIAAVLLRALEDILAYGPEGFSPLTFFFTVGLAYLLFYYFVSGNTDMARGLMAMYGLQPPRGQGNLLSCSTPMRLMEGTLLSLSRYLEDYVVRPITRRVGGLGGKLLGCVCVFVLTVFFYRMRPSMLLIALPMLVVALLTVRQRRWHAAPGHWYFRLPPTLFSCLCLSFFALAIAWQDPAELFSYIVGAARGVGTNSFYFVYSALPDAIYIAVLGVVTAIYLPLQHFWPTLSRRLRGKAYTAALAAMTILLIAGFIAALLHFMPQFPQYADKLSEKMFM